MIILSQAQVLALRSPAYQSRILRPRALSDGRYALNEAVLSDLAHAAKLSILSAGSIETPAAGLYLNAADFEFITGDAGKRLKINCADTSWAVQSPAAGVLRFELRSEDIGDPADPYHVRHRSELVGNANMFNASVDVWQSWSMRLRGDQSWRSDTPSVIATQWHSVDNDATGSRAPPISMQFTSGNEMYFATRSDALYETGRTGATVKRWQGLIPDVDVWRRVVTRTRFGASGQLDLYVDGAQVAALTGVPIGYYNDAGPLAYMQFGIYRQWKDNTMIVEYANQEWGTTSLFDRVANPLAIAT